MTRVAHVHLTSDSLELQFEWLDFDGDDCFKDFHINVVSKTGTCRIDFGECAVNGLRKFSRFIRDAEQRTVNGAFRHPDVRYYDVYREDDGFRLIVRIEGSGLQQEFRIRNPRTQIDDEFMRTVYSE